MELTTLERVKQYLDLTTEEFDAILEQKIEDISLLVRNYTNNTGFDTMLIGDVPVDLQNAIAKQVAYEWQRHKDLGLSSVTFPDGTISKLETDLFLSEVKQVLDYYKVYTV